MKLFPIGCLFALVALSLADDDVAPNLHPRGCIWILGNCVSDCEDGTHDYTTGCGYLTPEPTCDNPNPVEDRTGQVCDFSACYCDAPTVRDTTTDKCVPLDQCPKKSEESRLDSSEPKKE